METQTLIIPKQKVRSSAPHMPTRVCDTDKGKRYNRKNKAWKKEY